MDESLTVFEILTHKVKNGLFYHASIV